MKYDFVRVGFYQFAPSGSQWNRHLMNSCGYFHGLFIPGNEQDCK